LVTVSCLILCSEQLELKKQLICVDDFSWSYEAKEGTSTNNHKITLTLTGESKEPLKWIAGVDISFVKENNEDACASIVILEWPSLQAVIQL
jgi:hypothetical protein